MVLSFMKLLGSVQKIEIYCIIAGRVTIKGMEIALSRDRKLIFSVLLL